MTQHTKWSEIDLGHLDDRELLILAVQRINDLASHVEAQNGRIRKLEAWRDQAVGGLIVASMVVSALVSLALKLLQ